MLRVQELLYPELLCKNEIRSASDLVGLALSEGWINVEDVVGEGVDEVEEALDEASLTDQFENLTLEKDHTLSMIEVIPKAEAAVLKARTRRR